MACHFQGAALWASACAFYLHFTVEVSSCNLPATPGPE